MKLKEIKKEIKFTKSLLISLLVLNIIAVLFYKYVADMWQIGMLIGCFIGVKAILLLKLASDYADYYFTKDEYIK